MGKRAGSTILKAPPKYLWDFSIPTLIRLEHLRSKVREVVPGAIIRVNSGYRDQDYNNAVGGEDNSLHTQFNAFDFSVWARDKNDGEWEMAMLPSKVAAILETFPDSSKYGIGVYPTFVHLDTRGYLGNKAPARW